MVQDLLSSVLGVELSLGSVSKLESNVSAALDVPVEEARQHIQQAVIAHLDETGWREGRRKAWLWTAVTSMVTVFLIAASRGAAVAKQMLGEDFTGFLVTDRWSAYGWADLHLRQVCWSHLVRDFQGFVDRGGRGAVVGKQLLEQTRRMFKWWHRVRAGHCHGAPSRGGCATWNAKSGGCSRRPRCARTRRRPAWPRRFSSWRPPYGPSSK
jgi:transposase